MRFKIDWASLIVGSKFTVFALYLRAIFQVQVPGGGGGGLYLEGRFNGGFFALPIWGAYIWRGLYMEGLIFGILQYVLTAIFFNFYLGFRGMLGSRFKTSPSGMSSFPSSLLGL